MQISHRCLGRGVGPLVLILTTALLHLVLAAPAFAQSTPKFARSNDAGVLAGVLMQTKVKTQIEGSWNIQLVPSDDEGSQKRLFDWQPGQAETFVFSLDAVTDTYRFEIGNVIVENVDNDSIDSLFIHCFATAADTRATVNIHHLFVPASALPDQIHESVVADANGDPAEVLKIYSLPFNLGFTIGGTIQFDYVDPPPVELDADVLSCEILAADDPSPPGDRDSDGVLDNVDICPDNYDPLQEDTDLPMPDGIGDACDRCPDVYNPNEEDDDGDGIPEACDNCPFGCEAFTTKLTVLCPNSGQDDNDGDGRGNRCDNCEDTPNFDQADDDQDGRGNVCGLTGGESDEIGEEAESTSGGGLILSPLASLGGAETASATVRMFELKVDCGPRNVAEASFGFLLSNLVSLIDFAGCDPPDPDSIGDCTGAAGLDPLIVNDSASFTLGKGIPEPVPDPDPLTNIPFDLFVIHVEGARTVGGLARDVLCAAGDPPVVIGVLSLTGLPDEEQATINTAYLGQLGLSLIVDSDSVAIPAAQTITTYTPAETKATIDVSPAIEDVTATFATQVTLQSPFAIHQLGFGLQAAQSISSTDATFGGCNIPFTVGVPPNDVDFLGCADHADLGPTVAFSAGSAPLGTFVLPANNGVGKIANVQPNTTYVVLTGNIDQLPDPNSLQNSDTPTFLGIHRFVSAQAPPSVRFLGVPEVLQHMGATFTSAVVPSDSGETITTSNIALRVFLDPNEDTDGDGIYDDGDNCVNKKNFDQLDQGQPGLTVAEADQSDDIGDLCQCGDGDVLNLVLPGSVFLLDDVDACRDALADPAANPDVSDRCSVTGTADFDIADLMILEQALDPTVTEVTLDDIKQICQPAVQAN
jgi:hypothetical protein